MFYAPVLFSSLGSGETTALVQTIITGARLPFLSLLCEMRNLHVYARGLLDSLTKRCPCTSRNSHLIVTGVEPGAAAADATGHAVVSRRIERLIAVPLLPHMRSKRCCNSSGICDGGPRRLTHVALNNPKPHNAAADRVPFTAPQAR